MSNAATVEAGTVGDASREAGRALFERHLQCLLAGDIDGWVALWDERGIFEHPFAPPGFPKRIEGKAAIRDYMKDFPKTPEIARFTRVEIHATLDPEVHIVEFACEGRALATGKPYSQSYVCVFETRGGRITRYRDYWNPLVALESVGGLDALQKSFSGAHAQASAGA